MALPGFSRFEVQGSRFKVRCLPYLSRMQFASRASLGVVWGHSGHTLDMSYTHRTRSKPPFSISHTYPGRSIRRYVGCVLPAPTVLCRRLPGDTPACTRCGSLNPLYLQGIHSIFGVLRCFRSNRDGSPRGSPAFPHLINTQLQLGVGRARGITTASAVFYSVGSDRPGGENR
jgi:hypothetical protein